MFRAGEEDYQDFRGAAQPHLRDLWVCPSCRWLFFAVHDRQEYCTPQCAERARPARDLKEKMRAYRADKREREKRELAPRYRAVYNMRRDEPVPSVRTMRAHLKVFKALPAKTTRTPK
ncbi:MAG: hypothetical protein ABIH03_14935 [Pseudomonadota bacterium]